METGLGQLGFWLAVGIVIAAMIRPAAQIPSITPSGAKASHPVGGGGGTGRRRPACWENTKRGVSGWR